ncbi:MAG: branched-chain amino acid aminotransferase [Anaerovoracaceae bacterium]|nr:branched-chain amino acid aminotransferase [Bacillota bacterium]MDY3955028.1 branched-chain amino acid aminotransferase [Anaerovoracaceae bacterium]
MNYEFKKTLTDTPKEKPDPKSLGFGKIFTDHMFLMDYDTEKGWHDGRIVPYGPLQMDPAAVVFHYGQEMFEGLKAYKTAEGKVLLFRPDMNAKRTNATNDRMCMPQMDEDLYVACIKALVDVERDWIPDQPGTALYIRPFIIGDEAFLGVRPSNHYLFVIILSPVGSYYESSNGGLVANSIFVEDEYVRSVPGGTGYAKVGGNYAGALKAQEKAHANGCEQVLWLDAIEKKYVEEIGTSNAFFMIDNEIITAPLTGTILPGITRNSVLQLLRNWGYTVKEERLSMEDLFTAAKEGRLQEVFATGTAAVISPIGRLVYKGQSLEIGEGEVGPVSQKLYDTLYGIQTGAVKDEMGWTVTV